jgi:hypothetical protein
MHEQRPERAMTPGLLGVVRTLVYASLFVTLAVPGIALAQAFPGLREIALTPADLPPGFSIDVGRTMTESLPDGSTAYSVVMVREASAANVQDGPILVQQAVRRADGASVGAGEALAQIRNDLLRVGFEPTDEGPNDDGTISFKQTRAELTIHAVGFVKRDYVVFTAQAGLVRELTFSNVLQLAGVTSARLDAALGH